jgi:hypothetical protein
MLVVEKFKDLQIDEELVDLAYEAAKENRTLIWQNSFLSTFIRQKPSF